MKQTGRSRDFYAVQCSDAYDSARVVQVGVVSNTEQHVWYVIPEGFEIGAEAARIHGITTEMVHTRGVPFAQMASELLAIVSRYEYIVGHNVRFDVQVLAAEFYRRGMVEEMSVFMRVPARCSMQVARTRFGMYKKLSVLYTELTGNQIVQRHDALEDCQLAFDCWSRLHRLPLDLKYAQGDDTTVPVNQPTEDVLVEVALVEPVV